MTTPPTVPSPPIPERTNHPFLTYDMIYEIPAAIQKTHDKKEKRFQTIADKLKNRSSIYYTGCGTAFFSAMLGSNILSLANPGKVTFECVQALELANNHTIEEHTGTFGVSHSGITKTTLDALRFARSKASFTVGVTHFEQSPISKVVDETLLVGNGPDKSRCHTKCYSAGAIALTEIGLDLLLQMNAASSRLEEIRTELSALPG